jgi:hypothetical protein
LYFLKKWICSNILMKSYDVLMDIAGKISDTSDSLRRRYKLPLQVFKNFVLGSTFGHQ